MGTVSTDVLASFPIPRNVSSLLQRAGGSSAQVVKAAGFSSDKRLSWLLTQGQLLLWRYSDGINARLVSIHLPSQLANSSKCFVSVLTTEGNPNATAIACSDTGLIVAWPNVEYSTEPVMHQVASASDHASPSLATCAFTAVAPAASSGMLFVAALARADGSLFLIQGNQQGLHSKQLVSGQAPASEQRGVLSALGQALATAYTEVFDPTAKLIKRTPSGRPAVAVLARLVDIHHLHIYILTDNTLDCWQVTVGIRLSEQLLWSFHTVLAASSTTPISAAVNSSMALSDDHIFVLLTGTAVHGGMTSWIHRLSIKADTPPVHVQCAAVPPVLEDDGSAAPAPSVKQLHASGLTGEVLLVGPNHHLYEWCMHRGDEAGRCRLVSDDSETLATSVVDMRTSDDTPSCWLLLNAMYGVLQLSQGAADEQEDLRAAGAQGDRQAPAHTQQQQVVELTAEQKVQVAQVLDSTLGQAAAVQAAQQPLLTVAMGLRRRLASLGVLSGAAAAGVLASYSTGLMDTLPKQWTMGDLPTSGVSSTSTHILTSALLTAKEAKHSLLIQLLFQGGMLHNLPASVLRVLVENGEKLHAASKVLALHLRVLEEQASGNTSQGLMMQVVHQAGVLCGDDLSQESLPPHELVYSRPSVAMPALLQALGSAAVQVAEQAGSGLSRPGDTSAQVLVHHACTLAHLLHEVTCAVRVQQDLMQASYHVSAPHLHRQLAQASWLADGPAREAMDRLTLACQSVRRLLTSSHPAAAADAAGSTPLQLALSDSSFSCTEALLSSYAAAVLTTQGSDARAAVLPDYAAARERCLSSLLADACAQVDPAQPLPHNCLLLRVQELAAAHHSYPQLFDACEVVDGWLGQQPGASLHYHMTGVTAEEGAPETDTFARYCFQRLLDDGRPADLLQLPRSFYPDIRHFLQQQPKHANLLWPLLLRTQDWKEACHTLVLDAQAHHSTFKQQHRLICLAYLCAMRSGDLQAMDTTASWAQLLQAQAALLQLQAELGGAPLPGLSDVAMEPGALVEAALAAEAHGAGGKGAMLALQALATCPADVQQLHRQSWQSAWHSLVSATNWGAVHESQEAGCPQEAYTDALRQTPVFKAAAMCRGTSLMGRGLAGVHDTKPVQDSLALIKQLCANDSKALQHAVQAFELAINLADGPAA